MSSSGGGGGGGSGDGGMSHLLHTEGAIQIYNRLSIEYDVPLGFAKAAFVLIVGIIPAAAEAVRDGNNVRYECLLKSVEVSLCMIGVDVLHLPPMRVHNFVVEICKETLIWCQEANDRLTAAMSKAETEDKTKRG